MFKFNSKEANMKIKRTIYTGTLLTITSLMIITSGCTKKSSNTNTTSSALQFSQVNLVADVGSFTGARVDTNLVNAWGVAISPTGRIWISSTGKNKTTIYDGTGATIIAPIAIPNSGSRSSLASGPTGTVFNNTTDFVVPADNAASKFIYVNLDGTVEAWATGTSAKIVANRSSMGASYTGCALGKVGNVNYLYAANFDQGKVDVFNATFGYTVSFTFVDPNIPQGYAPYNIVNINGDLYVTYANTANLYAGNGYVNIFSPDGTIIKRFASGGTLNFPWAVAIAPAGFGLGLNMILVGNFGDGSISIFDQNGNSKGQLQSNGTTLFIDGLWALAPAPSTASTLDQDAIYFTAGPSLQAHGLFGYLKQTSLVTGY